MLPERTSLNDVTDGESVNGVLPSVAIGLTKRYHADYERTLLKHILLQEGRGCLHLWDKELAQCLAVRLPIRAGWSRP
jgi:hypothetical protein